MLGGAQPRGKCSSRLRGSGCGWEGAQAGARRAGLEGAEPRGPRSHPPSLRRGHGAKLQPLSRLSLLLRVLSAGLQPWPTAARKVGRADCHGDRLTSACRGQADCAAWPPQASAPHDPNAGAGSPTAVRGAFPGSLGRVGQRGRRPRFANEKTETLGGSRLVQGHGGASNPDLRGTSTWGSS